MKLVPSLTRNQWLWLGGAVALGVTEVVSAPIAVVLAALPVLDNLSSDEPRGSRSSANGSARPRAASRRRSAPAAAASANGVSRRRGSRRGARRRSSTTTTTTA